MDEVTIRCPCPGTPHPDGDTIGLKPKLGLREGVAVQSALLGVPGIKQGKADSAEATGILSEAYVLQGVAEWSLVDELGKPLPVTKDAIRDVLLSDFSLAGPVADKCDELYMESVVLPLVEAVSRSSRNGSTDASTSRRSGQSRKPRTPSKQSSTSTTPTEDTTTTTE